MKRAEKLSPPLLVSENHHKSVSGLTALNHKSSNHQCKLCVEFVIGNHKLKSHVGTHP